MRIETIGAGPCVDFAVSDTTVQIGSVAIDCAARQADVREIVDIRATGAEIAEGAGDALVASVVIPPRRYVEVGDGEEATLEATPLDGDDVVLRLWPFRAEG